MSRAKIFNNYPEKLQTCSIKELEEWLNFWNVRLTWLKAGGYKQAIREKIMVEGLLAKRRNETLYDKQNEQKKSHE